MLNDKENILSQGFMGNSEWQEHEQVVFCHDQLTGLKAIIAIHNTTLGPALGGCRFWDYTSEEEALTDVLRLSRGMTYKAAVAGLQLGGGKSVIIGDPKKLKNEELFRVFGRFVNSLGGRYITAEDVNVRVADMNFVAKETHYVTGVSSQAGGSGDPSPMTSLGVFRGIEASVEFRLGKKNLKGITVAVQGCGAVGYHLCQLLHKAGAQLIVADLNSALAGKVVQDFAAKQVRVDDILLQKADVLAPCALGAILNTETISTLQVPIVAGAANNQLADEEGGVEELYQRDILYAPDYVINAGGLINVYHELKGYNKEAAAKEVNKIKETLLSIYNIAAEKKKTTLEASNFLAETRLQKATQDDQERLKKTYDNQAWIQRKSKA